MGFGQPLSRIPISLAIISLCSAGINHLRIGGGVEVDITKYPHSLFIRFLKYGRYPECGGSLITQGIILTAATCFFDVPSQFNPRYIKVSMGNEDEGSGQARKVIDVKLHEHFTKKHAFANDIALGKVDRKICFGQNIQRVALMRNPPTYQTGYVAGWGWIDEYRNTSVKLHHLRQDHMPMEKCREVYTDYLTPAPGTFCMENQKGRPYIGDTGAALVVDGYIQIGLVSWGYEKVSYGTIVYTNVSYHMDWIEENTKKLYCKFN